MNAETPKMMLGFVVRQCAVELGHPPNAHELAAWANYRRGHRGSYRLFGREISVREAALILENPQRMVAINGDWQARVGVTMEAAPGQPRGQVVALDVARRRSR